MGIIPNGTSNTARKAMSLFLNREVVEFLELTREN